MKLQKQLAIVLTILTLTAFKASAQPVVFDWSRGVAGKSNNTGEIGMVKDAAGDIYVFGHFSGTRAFGSTQLTAVGASDIFVAKFSQFGPVLWAIRGGSGFSSAFAGGIMIEGSNLIITGSYTNQFSLGSGCLIGSGAANKDIFIASITTANGACNWVVTAGGNADDAGISITPATGGGFYVNGNFSGTANFGSLSVSTSSTLDSDVFYAKYTSSGTCTWVRKFGGLGSESAGGLKEVDANNIVMNGSFEATVSYPTGSINSAGAYDFFLTKFNSQGNIIWATSGGGLDSEAGYAVDVDTSGNIYSAGSIGNDVTFGTVFVPSQQNANMFISKHNSNGGCQWVKMGGNITDDVASDLCTDPNGSSYVTGYVSQDALFSTTWLTGVQGSDAYVVKYNTFGNIVWITKIGSPGTEAGKAIIYAGTGSVYTAGEFDQPLSITANTLNPPTNAFGIYVTKLGGGSVGLNELTEKSFNLYPNPAVSEINLDLSKISDEAFTIEITGIDGKIMQSVLVKKSDATSSYRMNVENLASGNYLVRIYSSKGDFSLPLVKH